MIEDITLAMVAPRTATGIAHVTDYENRTMKPTVEQTMELYKMCQNLTKDVSAHQLGHN